MKIRVMKDVEHVSRRWCMQETRGCEGIECEIAFREARKSDIIK